MRCRGAGGPPLGPAAGAHPRHHFRLNFAGGLGQSPEDFSCMAVSSPTAYQASILGPTVPKLITAAQHSPSDDQEVEGRRKNQAGRRTGGLVADTERMASGIQRRDPLLPLEGPDQCPGTALLIGHRQTDDTKLCIGQNCEINGLSRQQAAHDLFSRGQPGNPARPTREFAAPNARSPKGPGPTPFPSRPGPRPSAAHSSGESP